jgi:hypothetical protein
LILDWNIVQIEGAFLETAKNVTAVASLLEAVSMTAKTASHRAGRGSGWFVNEQLLAAEESAPHEASTVSGEEDIWKRNESARNKDGR